jgi:hypothetical protein
VMLLAGASPIGPSIEKRAPKLVPSVEPSTTTCPENIPETRKVFSAAMPLTLSVGPTPLPDGTTRFRNKLDTLTFFPLTC